MRMKTMRCRGCNRLMDSEDIEWYPSEHTHEDLCYKCKKVSLSSMLEMGWDIAHLVPVGEDDE